MRTPVRLEGLPEGLRARADHKTVLLRQQAFDYTAEDVRILIAADGRRRQ